MTTSAFGDGAAGADARHLLELYEVSDADLERIRAYGRRILPRIDEMVTSFYRWLERQPEYAEYFASAATLDRVKELQATYWREFLSGSVDDAYVAGRQLVGETHARIGLPLDTYLAAMNRSLDLMSDTLYDGGLSDDQYAATVRSLTKLLHLDLAIVMGTFNARTQAIISDQAQTLMQMSTPVAEVWRGVLLVPIVGLIDSKRASDVMDAMLTAIGSSRARAIILDIRGVAVVDTAVANHLIKITRATRLMGCECTLSGISPAIAQTMVELGIEVGNVKTTATLSDALAHALDQIGVEVRDKTVNELSPDAVEVPLQVTRGCLVASFQEDLGMATFERFQARLLERIEATSVRGVVLDVSGVAIMDAEDFRQLRAAMRMSELMGAPPVLVGLRPGIVAALVEMDVDLAGVRAALDLDQGLDLLERSASG